MPKAKSVDPAAERAFRAWLHAAHTPAHSRRTAATNAAFFLPYLRPGMRLLDAGCGPGSITLGLAAAVPPGPVVGIDANPSAIESARRSAQEAGQANVRFEVADIHRLPFPDSSFDAVFVHAVLQHVPDALEALRQLRRIVKPGGVIGVADADYGGSIIWPAPRPLQRAVKLMERVRMASGGDLLVGRKLCQVLAGAGFSNVTGSAVAGVDGSAEANHRTGEFWAAYCSSPELLAHAAATGLASEGEMREAAAAWQAWGTEPGSYWARFWCQAVATNPG